MIIAVIGQIVEKDGGKHPLYIRTLIKEALQNYILHFIYNHERYKEFIFTGGTCLRKLYGLPRLSEDIDFDYIKPVHISSLASDLVAYFVKSQQYKQIETKIANNERTIFVKFPTLLTDMGLVKNRGNATQLFVRVDLAPAATGSYKTEIRPVQTHEFTFFVKAYDLSTLCTNKMIAFLRRDFYKSKTQTVAFKGRDVFDLVWFFEMMQKRQDIVPQWDRLYQVLQVKKKADVTLQLVHKIKLLDPNDVHRDLEPFIESPQTVAAFSTNMQEALLTGVHVLEK